MDHFIVCLRLGSGAERFLGRLCALLEELVTFVVVVVILCEKKSR